MKHIGLFVQHTYIEETCDIELLHFSEKIFENVHKL